MESRPAPGGQRQPLALVGCDVAQVLAHQRGVVQVVVLDYGLIAKEDLLWSGQQLQVPMFQYVLFVGGKFTAFVFAHAASLEKCKGDVPQNRLSS